MTMWWQRIPYGLNRVRPDGGVYIKSLDVQTNVRIHGNIEVDGTIVGAEFNFEDQPANVVLAGAGSGGGTSEPAFRTLVADDIPNLNASKITAGDIASARIASAFAALAFSTQILVDGATINWDLALGAQATVTLGGNRTLAAPSNLVNGKSYVLIIKQDATGNRTLSWNAAYKFPGGTDPVLSTGANAIDIATFLCDGTSLYGSMLKAFS